MSNVVGNRVAPVTTETWVPETSTEPRRRSIIREFALNTSTHGLPGIARSQSKHNCIFWTVSFLIFTGITIYFVTQSINDYFQYPTQTTVSIVIERPQAFPAVTFCNYCPIRYDRILGIISNLTNTTVFTYEQSLLLRDHLQNLVNAGQSVNDYFFSLDTMLMACSYNGVPCSSDDFILFLSSMHGNCFTFNAKTNKPNGSDIRYTNDNGGVGYLKLILYAHSHLYIPYVSADVSVGMVAMIHNNTQLPLIDIAGIELATGRKHKFGYKKRTTRFLPAPYTDCTDKVPLIMRAMFDRYQGADYTYSQGVCYTLCVQAYTYQQCGCVNPNEWSARSVLSPETNTIIQAPLCPIANTCYIAAALRLTNTTSLWDEFCSSCTQECYTVDFSLTASSVAAPSLPHAYLAKTFVENVLVPLPANWSTNWLTEVQNNYVSLEVVCESIQVENYIQEASFSAVDVLSSVGGHTGLWIGISFLSIMEFVEMLYRLFRYESRVIIRAFREKIRANT